MIVGKFSPLWWVMFIANLLQLSFMPSFPFFQRTCARSIDRQISQAFTTDLAFSLDTCGSTDLVNYKVRFAPWCRLWWWMSATWSLSSRLPTIAQLSSTGTFLPSADPFTCMALWWDYLRSSDRTSWVSRRWSIHILSSAIARFLTVAWLASCQLLSCSHVLFQLKCRKSTGARTPNQWPSVTLSPPTEGPNWLLWELHQVQLDWCAEHR